MAGASQTSLAPARAQPPLQTLGDLFATAAADRLHDGPVQSLVAARYAADLAVRGGDPLLVRDAVQIALVELRSALWHLRPRTSAEDGLAAALDLLSAQLVRDSRPGLALDLAPEAGDEPVFAALAYRLVQAAALASGEQALSVVVRRTPIGSRLTVTGSADAIDGPAWSHAVAALGGRLTLTAQTLELDLPCNPAPTEVAP